MVEARPRVLCCWVMSKRRHPLRPVVAKLKAEAKRCNLTAYRLAPSTGLTEQTVQRLFDGKGEPKLETLEAVAKALGMRIDATF